MMLFCRSHSCSSSESCCTVVVLSVMALQSAVCVLPPDLESKDTTSAKRAKQRSAGQWVPAAQMRDGLAVFPLDEILEQVGQPPAAGDAGDVGDPATGTDRDDESLV